MFLEIILFTCIGIILGILTGLAPGIHPNLVVLAVPFLISFNLHPYCLLALIVSMAVVNTVLDTLPSILLGAPEPGSELSVLPGHELLMEGFGYQAIKFAVTGSFFSVIFCILLLPLLIFLVPPSYEIIKPFLYIILISILVIMLYTEKSRLKTTIIIILAGVIGLISFQLPVSGDMLLFPILTGLFGMSTLLIQIKNRSIIPEQHEEEYEYPKKSLIKNSFLGTIAGTFSGLIPAFGTSQAAYFASSRKKESFLVVIGAIGTSNIIVSFLSLWLIGKARSGVALATENFITISFNEFLLIAAVSVVSCSISVIIALKIAKSFLSFLRKINYTMISLVILIVLNILIFIFSGFLGLFLAWICTFLGIYTILANVRRSHLLAVLIIPTILILVGV